MMSVMLCLKLQEKKTQVDKLVGIQLKTRENQKERPTDECVLSVVCVCVCVCPYFMFIPYMCLCTRKVHWVN